ncbi:MAG: acyltransferase [Candidatus Omnitrophota bacterium]|nr:acyltransferase [Candidatus Omnitrophota bacterium]
MKNFPKNPYNKYCWIIGEPEIGEGTWIGPFTIIDAQREKLRIGKGCDISAGVHVYTHNTVKRCVSARKYNKVDTGPVSIGDHVFIGANSTILMNTQIGSHSVIGAGTVITEGSVIPAYSVVAGVPGKVVRSLKKSLKKSKR